MAMSRSRTGGGKSTSIDRLTCDNPIGLLERIKAAGGEVKTDNGPPKGAYTAVQWTKRWCVNQATTNQMIKQAIALGFMEAVKYRSVRIDGRPDLRTAYREIAK
jgi:hypothetical protein